MLTYPYNYTFNDVSVRAQVTVPDFDELEPIELEGRYLSELDVFEGTKNYNKVVEKVAAAMSARRKAGQPIPPPSSARPNQRLLYLPAYIAAKLTLAHYMEAAKVRKATLADKMDCTPSYISQMLDLTNPSKIDTLLTALRLLGVKPDMGLMYPEWYDHDATIKRQDAEWNGPVRLTAAGSLRFWNFIATHANTFVPAGNYLSALQLAMLACRYEKKSLTWLLERGWSTDKNQHQLTMTEGTHVQFIDQPGAHLFD